MRQAFTMIELIFVILIIGLLAGIAVPKFLATRDDAKVSQIMHNVATASQEIATYAMSRGTIESDFVKMSNAVLTMIGASEAVQSGDMLNVKMGNASECLTMTIDNTNNVKIINISHGNTQGDTNCIALQNIMDEKRYDIPISGQFIKH